MLNGLTILYSKFVVSNEETSENMDILRDYQPALAVKSSDREATFDDANSSTSERISMQNSIDGLIADSTSEKSKPPVEIVTDRFSANYTNKIYPQKNVSYALLKRAFDVVFSLSVLFFAWPIMAFAACLVKITSPGPMIFKQVRVGKGGRYFTCLKFRSMCNDAEYQKKQLMHLNEANGPVFKIKRDPRITPVGSFIRKFSIDELPQLFNVLKGEMSVVGPRPPIPAEVEQYTEYQRGRLAVKPGLTCLWQVSGRSNVSFDKWVELDLIYIQTMSFSNDFIIVLKTIPAVLLGSGAH